LIEHTLKIGSESQKSDALALANLLIKKGMKQFKDFEN
jgi:hypothetical protein